ILCSRFGAAVCCSPYQDLNFFAFGGFSPLSILSAPKALPLAGQPYLGQKTLFQTLQDEPVDIIARKAEANNMFRVVFIRFPYLERCRSHKYCRPLCCPAPFQAIAVRLAVKPVQQYLLCRFLDI